MGAVAYNYSDLFQIVQDTSKGLLSMGYGPNSRIATCLLNTSTNVVFQLSCALTGTTLVTTKDPLGVQDLSDQFQCNGIFTQDVYEELQEIGKRSNIKDICQAKGDEEFAIYGGGKTSVSLDSLVALADKTAQHFSLTKDDVIAVPVSLNHSMGMGCGILPALLSGSQAVLPANIVDPELIVEALLNQQATLLIADTHMLNEVNTLGKGKKFALRGGLVKIGSGEDISSTEVRDVLGVSFDTIGVPR